LGFDWNGKFFYWLGIGFFIHIPRWLNLTFLSSFFNIEHSSQSLTSEGELIPIFGAWWNNSGVLLFCVFGLAWFKLSRLEYVLFGPCFLTFAILNIWKFQQFVEYNATVVLVVIYPITSVVFISVMWRFVCHPEEKEARGVLAALSVICCISFCLASTMGIVRQLGNCRQAWGPSEEALGNWILGNTDKRDVFLTVPLSPVHPVSVLAGRALWVSLAPIVELSGFNGTTRLAEVAKFELGQQAVFNVKYLVVGDSKMSWNQSAWKQVYSGRDYIVYRVGGA
jgi:hypothetical protein